MLQIRDTHKCHTYHQNWYHWHLWENDGLEGNGDVNPSIVRYVNVEGTSTTGEFAEVCPGDLNTAIVETSTNTSILWGEEKLRKKIKNRGC